MTRLATLGLLLVFAGCVPESTADIPDTVVGIWVTLAIAGTVGVGAVGMALSAARKVQRKVVALEHRIEALERRDGSGGEGAKAE